MYNYIARECHSLALPLSLKLNKTASCDSKLSMAAPMVISTICIHRSNLIVTFPSKVAIIKTAVEPYTLLGHRNVSRWHSRCYMVINLSDQRCLSRIKA